MIRVAATYGMTVILDPIETAGWLNILKANGVAGAFAYGQYLGQRYKEFPNLIWMHTTTSSRGGIRCTTRWCKPSHEDQEYGSQPSPLGRAQFSDKRLAG